MLEEVGGIEGLNDIWSYLHFAAGAEVHFQSVRSLYQARETILESPKMIKDLRNPKVLVSETVQQYVESILSKISIGVKTEERPFRKLVLDALDDLEQRMHNSKITGVTFGVPKLDEELYGLQPAEKCVIAAETGGGKSALASQAIVQHSLEDKASAVFSLEMSATSLIHRMFANIGKVPMGSMKRGRLSEYEVVNLHRAVATLAEFKIFMDPSRDIAAISNRCRYLKNKYDISLIVVDYIQLVGSKFSNNKERHERLVADISHGISDLAVELNVPVIAMSQLNDDGYLRDSRAIGHDADIVLKIESSTKNDQHKFINIVKQRNGERGKRVPVKFDGQLMEFSDRNECNGKTSEEKPRKEWYK